MVMQELSYTTISTNPIQTYFIIPIHIPQLTPDKPYLQYLPQSDLPLSAELPDI